MKKCNDWLHVFYCGILLLFLFHTKIASAGVTYSNDFDGNISIDSGVSVSGFDNGTLQSAASGFGNWSGSYFDNRSTGNPATMSTLTLTGLKAHTSIDINFILGFLESWDSTNGDYLYFYIDGTQVASLTTNNSTGSVESYEGGTELYENVAVNSINWGPDTLVDMSSAGFLNFAHTASILTLGIQAGGSHWQGGTDEGWGIDNLVIEYDSIPEPFPLALLSLGLVGIGVSRCK